MSRLLKIPEAAAELSIGRSRLYELIQPAMSRQSESVSAGCASPRPSWTDS